MNIKQIRELAGSVWMTIRFWLSVIAHSIVAPIRIIIESLVMGILFSIAFYIASWGAVNGYIDKAISEGYLSDVSGIVRALAVSAAVYIIFVALNILYRPAKLYNDARRKGKIIVGAPSTYAAIAHPKDDFLLVHLPLIFNNTSDVAVVVQGLQLSLEQNGRRSPVLKFNQTVPKLAASQKGNWAKQFIVDSKKSVDLICEFLRKPRDGFVFSEGACDAVLEAKFDSDQKWSEVTKFKLYTPSRYLGALNSTGPLIAYGNDPN